MLVPSDRTIQIRIWCVVTVVVAAAVVEVVSLNGPNVCMVKQKYNITKRVKYRAPMSIRTYEWCFSMPPRCSKWNTEMRDLTRLETEERTAEVAVCCPGYKMKDVSCVPICPNGKTGHRCSEDCPPNKWGPNCVHECAKCDHGRCSPTTGECDCDDGWQGESCSVSMPTTPSTTTKMEEILTTAKPTTKTTPQTTTKPTEPTTRSTTETAVPSTTPLKVVTSPTTTTAPTTTTTITTRIVPSTTGTTIAAATSPAALGEISNTTTTPMWTVESNNMFKTSKPILTNSNYNRTEIPLETTDSISTKAMYATTKKQILTTLAHITSTALPSTTTSMPSTSLIKISVKETLAKTESSKRPETTAKITTTKTKPKEIWIRPTQRGESSFIESKVKTNHELPHSRHRSATRNEETPELTTPRTIVVSIIPTSVSYVTFKKIALTTASYMSQKNNVTLKQPNNRTEPAVTKPLTYQQSSTAMPFTIKILSTLLSKTTSTISPPLIRNVTKTTPPKHGDYILNTTKLYSTSKPTNSMSSTYAANKKLNTSNILTNTSPSTNRTQGLRTYGTTVKLFKPTSLNHQTTSGRSTTHETTSALPIITSSRSATISSTSNVMKLRHTEKPKIVPLKPETMAPRITDSPAKSTKLMATEHSQTTNDTKRNITKVSNTKSNSMTTVGPLEDETFHILTEPEHITAVMTDKERDHSSVDLISVISIAGGVMMAVITVAVIIVMVERCRRPRYEDVRKINDIRMQVMIDNNDVPPPYVRSIFHTPLPDPPTSEKCHYQPLSTLDRNLKQFMRPVVVQTISPIMLENFRGILECHYDHLPQRNYDSETISTRCSITPSMACTEELRGQRALSVTDYTIEALKCEAKLDVIDNTTSEPLYAEIPCWRPPSEHAIEVLNLNGEAVTEL